MMSADRYSQNAKQALRVGHAFARECNHPEVDTDHLFVGIMQTPSSVGKQVLIDFGLNLDDVLDFVESQHHIGHKTTEKLPFSQALREALGLAIAESQWLNHDYIGTEHMLLGLLRGGHGQLGVLLNELNIKSDQIRGRIKRLMQDGTSEITLEAVRRMAKLSELGRRVFFAAEYISRINDCNMVLPQHLLLALAQERRSVAYSILPECGLAIEELRHDVGHLRSTNNGMQSITNRLVDGAVDRAEILGTHYTGTEHMLLAISVDPDGQDLLTSYGVDLQHLQNHLRTILLK